MLLQTQNRSSQKIWQTQHFLRNSRPAQVSNEKEKKKACQNSIDTHPAQAPEGKTLRKSG